MASDNVIHVIFGRVPQWVFPNPEPEPEPERIYCVDDYCVDDYVE